jgi:aminocarboxymuconate-semialdehyde decarboxylase
MSEQWLDIFTHIFPETYLEKMTAVSPKLGDIGKRLRSIRPLYDLDARFKTMDALGDYRQVITLPHPPLEEIVTGVVATDLAKIANDGMADLCGKYPDRFAAFAATVSLHDVPGAIAELDRAVTQLGARGVQIYTNVDGRPLDDERFEPFLDAIARHDLPLWLHPARTAEMSDYRGESRSRFEMWWCFGWPYETSVAMARLVFAGVFDRIPNLKIITHHLGGMIPYYDGRVGPGMAVLGQRTSDEDYSGVLSGLDRPHLEYFRQFYADTAMFGGTNGLKCGVDFFGVDRIVFASDAPLSSIPATIKALDALDLDPTELDAIRFGNARKLLRLDA